MSILAKWTSFPDWGVSVYLSHVHYTYMGYHSALTWWRVDNLGRHLELHLWLGARSGSLGDCRSRDLTHRWSRDLVSHWWLGDIQEGPCVVLALFVIPVFVALLNVLGKTELPSKSKYEPPHDKTNKMACAPSKDLDQPGHSPSLIRVFAGHSVGS